MKNSIISKGAPIRLLADFAKKDLCKNHKISSLKNHKKLCRPEKCLDIFKVLKGKNMHHRTYYQVSYYLKLKDRRDVELLRE